MLKFLKKNPLISFLSVYVLLRIVLLNFNIAEWGDTYTFLEAARKIIETGTYPITEKRLPVYPALIALGMPFLDSLFWARVVVLVFSILTLLITYRLSQRLFPHQSSAFHLLPSVFLATNPFFAYWSLRALADVVFVLWVVTAIYLLVRLLESRKPQELTAIGLGLTTTLASLTRYEGILLIPIIVGFLAWQRRWRGVVYSLVPVTVILGLWFGRNFVLTGNPLGAAAFYLDWRTGKNPYTLSFRAMYLVNFLLLTGLPIGVLWGWRGIKKITANGKRWRFTLGPILGYTLLNLTFLAVYHSQSRYYLSLTPFFSIFLAVGLQKLWPTKQRWGTLLAASALTIIYAILIVLFRIDFSIEAKFILVPFTGLSIFLLLLQHHMKHRMFYTDRIRSLIIAGFLMGAVTASALALYDDRYLYKTVVEAIETLPADAKVAYGDQTGVTSWQLRENGVYLNEKLSANEQLKWLRRQNVEYILWTNEVESRANHLNVVKEPGFASGFKLVKRFEFQKVSPYDPIFSFFGLQSKLPQPFLRVSEIYRLKV